jgi:hypothetical protein
MSRFTSNKTIKHELDGDEFVELKASLSYAEMEPIMLTMDKENEMANVKMSIPLLECAIVGWNLKDDDGKEVPFAKEKIKELDMNTVLELVQTCTTLYFPQKKRQEA